MIKNVIFWLNCARVYSLPITVLNWLVIFVFSLKSGGNALLGVVALFGIGLVHMATNLLDDYFDYKDEKYMQSAQNCKCAYLKSGEATVKDLKNAIIVFLSVAALIGCFLFLKSGVYVALLAFIGFVVAVTYQKFSINGLGEISIIIAYGPLLYEGVYYVMTGKFAWVVCLLSLSCAFITNTILYVHMLMDFDGDFEAGKKTLCTTLKTKENALKALGVFYLIGFILLLAFAFVIKDFWLLLTFVIVPEIFDLYNSMRKFNLDKQSMPKIYPWHYPLDNWKTIENTKDAPFYFRFFFSRNIVTLFMLLVCFAILIG